ncbi:metal transporter [Siccirubricoccus deserti]|uniref:TolC family protein n=1 Tax=Siccirubricoccus deserti TaxID=2013562 RepID=A0A9X0UBI6_9PROT|nr:TolC family protein [Siccirubricoccus deserti]MBC4013929.1 TolC family protein [Siccirubricoccus deserti]GGC30656.1 metal transporter [Siccirubricoccus deserti]
MRGWIALLGLALLAPAALAQAQAPVAAPIGTAALPTGRGAQPLTLAEAEALLVERNLGLIAARRGLDATRAQRLVASALPPPQVSVGSSFGQFNETARGALQGARLLSPSSNINVGLSVLVERGGKRELRTRVADQQIGQAEAQVLDALRTQLFQLRQAFLGALLARANLEVALANRASLDRTEALLRRQLRDGAIPEGDLLRFQASRLQFESDVTGNAQAYAAGIATVAALLAADPAAFAPGAGQIGGPGLVAPGLRGTAAPRQGSAAVPTTVQTILSPVAFDLRGRLDQMPVLGIGREALAEGVASRADVVAAQRQASAADANRQLAEAERSRDVTVNGSWGRSRLSQDLPNSRDQLDAVNSFGLSLSVPIFTRRIVEGNLGVATAQAGQAEALARATLLQARTEFAAAWAGYEQARALLNLYTSGALGRAEDAYRSAEQAYVAGGRSLLEVLDALRTLNATRIQANQARHAYLLALATLEQASGVSGVAPRL